jgi:transposase InsO family protein
MREGGIFGYRRLTMHLNRELESNLNSKRIYRLMKLMGMQSVIRRKKKRYIKSNPQHIAENVLNRDFTAQMPNEKWLTDITEFKYGNEQKAYLSAILDLYDHSIIAYVLGTSNNNSLVLTTLNQALEANPGAKPLLHSDRGFQYTSITFKAKTESLMIRQSMSRVGKCNDNGPMEGFWGILKCEKYYLNHYATFQELNQAIDEYIEFYNFRRLQKRLNSQSPIEYRALAA